MNVHKRGISASKEKDDMNTDNNIMANNIPELALHNRAGFAEENDMMLPTMMAPNKELSPEKQVRSRLPKKDYRAFIVLIILYTLQGVPVGLAFGSVPFILKTKVSYAQVGVFLLASYPYSLKLLWSPIVDAIYHKRVGRRKSWIIPVQLISGVTLLYLALTINHYMLDPAKYLSQITASFFLLVLFCATQDIAVDGWALTCLSPESLSFASTAQTIGMNCGYFSSFTVFLALSSPEFANKYIRKTPQISGLVSLSGYLAFWGWMYILVTGLLFFIPEDPPHLVKQNHDKRSAEHYKEESFYNKEHGKSVGHKHYFQELFRVYHSMYEVLKLPNVQTLVVILLIAKLGFQVNEAATNLKLLEKGLSKEDLSITVLIDFPFELIFGYYAGRWSSGKGPLKPWLLGFAGRLFSASLAHLILLFLPISGPNGVSIRVFFVIICQHLLNSFMSTVQFVSLCAFFTKIADPSIGGTYMTTLNTLSNYGGTWPRLIILFLIDKFTEAKCIMGSSHETYKFYSEDEKQKCLASGGEVQILRDGYFYCSTLCITLGIIIWFWVKKKTTHLQALPQSAWRVNK